MSKNFGKSGSIRKLAGKKEKPVIMGQQSAPFPQLSPRSVSASTAPLSAQSGSSPGPYTEYGMASWFCCGSAYPPWCSAKGSGACGTCDSHKIQCAWPKVVGHGKNYCAACYPNLPAFKCGDVLSLTNLCTNKTIQVAVSDHGPGACCNVTKKPVCKAVKNTRLIDLTPAAFAAMGGDFAVGVYPIKVTG